MLKKEAIDDFVRIYKEEFNIQLDENEASQIAERFLIAFKEVNINKT